MASRRFTAGPCFLLLLALPACAQWMQRSAPPPSPVKNALRFSHGIPLVEVRGPEDQKAWFVVDTGAGQFTFVDPSLSRTLGLKCDVVRDPAVPFVYLSAEVPFLELDGFGRRALTVYVTETSERATYSALDVKVQGALGTGFFRGQCLRFDWGKGEFTPNDPRQPLARHVALPLHFGANGELYCTLRVDGVQCQALIDTASPQSLVTREFADTAKLEVDRKGPAVPIDTSIGQVPVRDGKVGCLGLGALEVRDLAVGVVERRMPHANFLLGTDVLSRFGVLLDLADEPYLIFDPVEGGSKGAAPPEAPAKKPEEKAPGEKPAAADAPPPEAPRRKGD
jgi:predicted aspartyl protease